MTFANLLQTFPRKLGLTPKRTIYRTAKEGVFVFLDRAQNAPLCSAGGGWAVYVAALSLEFGPNPGIIPNPGSRPDDTALEGLLDRFGPNRQYDRQYDG